MVVFFFFVNGLCRNIYAVNDFCMVCNEEMEESADAEQRRIMCWNFDSNTLFGRFYFISAKKKRAEVWREVDWFILRTPAARVHFEMF